MQINFDNIHSTQVSETILKKLQTSNRFSTAYKSEHFIGRNAKKEIENSRAKIAKSVNVFPGEIIFSHDYLQSYLLIFKLIKFLKIDYFITSETENELFLQILTPFAKENKIEIIFVDYSSYAFLDLESLENTLSTASNAMVFLSHVNLYSGHLLPAKKIAKLCSKYHSFFGTDISVSLMNFKINIESLNVDIAIFSPNTIHGFSGIQALYLKSKLISDIDFLNLFYLKKREYSSSSINLIKSFELSILELDKNRKNTSTHLESLKKYFILNFQKSNLPFEILFYESKNTVNSLLVLSLPYSKFHEHFFDMTGIAIYVLPSKDKVFHRVKNKSLIVISFSKYNTFAEIEFFISIIKNRKA